MAGDINYMLRCIELAAKGAGFVSPNPLVGCVVTHNDKIIGEGYHYKLGGRHAEVVAIESVSDKGLLKNSTLYVNLEPCSHYGKTPPCSQLIIRHKIPRVVIGCLDPNPLVSGKGIAMLRNTGIEVIEGMALKESVFLNRAFNTYHALKRPYIILKWAQTSDGYIDKARKLGEVGVNWISDIKLKALVHRWRSESDAILAGAGTIIADNPELTTRNWPGGSPLRVILDASGELSSKYRVFNGNTPTLLFTSQHGTPYNSNVEVRDISHSNLNLVMETLYQKGIQSLIVEGGKTVLENFISQGLWDEYRVIAGKVIFYSGLAAPKLPSKPSFINCYGSDKVLVGYNKSDFNNVK